MKRQNNNDGILTPTTYWEMKLGIKHSTEKIRYKKLCGYRLSKEDKSQLDGAYYITFSDWSEYINDKLSVLDARELFEYSKYINGKVENESVFNEIFSSFLSPLLTAIIPALLADTAALYIKESYNNLIVDYIALILKYSIYFIGFFMPLKTVIDSARENKSAHLFYKDMYNIIVTKLDTLNESKSQ